MKRAWKIPGNLFVEHGKVFSLPPAEIPVEDFTQQEAAKTERGVGGVMSETNGLPELPKGWTWTTIGEVVEPSIEQGSPTDRAEFLYVDISSIDNKTKRIIEPKTLPTSEAPSRAKQHLMRQDVVVSMTRPNLNAVALLPQEMSDAIGSTGFCVLRAIEINPSLLFYLVQTETFISEMSLLVQGALYPAVRPKDIFSYKFSLPPLPEQQRIVAKIEELFTKLDAGVDALRKARAQLGRYRQAVLKAAVTGKLTERWREAHRGELEPAADLLARILEERRAKWERDQLAKMQAAGKPPKNDDWKRKYQEPAAPDTSELPELPEGWIWVISDSFFTFVTSGSRGWAKHYSDSGSLFIRMGNLDHDSITLDLSEIQRVQPPSGTEGTRTLVQSGDVLVSVTADVGMIAVVPEQIEEAYINQHIALARPVKTICVEFLAWFLASQEGGQSQFKLLQRGATKTGLGLDDIRAVNVPLPSLTEQQQIVSEVERLLSIADAMEQTIAQSLKQAERLRQSILQQAFAGKLVPQDPADEPATVLLERIRQERAARANDKPRTARRQKSKSAAGQTAGRLFS